MVKKANLTVRVFGSKKNVLKVSEILQQHFVDAWIVGPLVNRHDTSQGTHRLYVNICTGDENDKK